MNVTGWDLAEDIDRLKRETGGVILAHGGATFAGALIHNGLIDEYRLVIHPVAIGHGTGLRAPRAATARFDRSSQVSGWNRHPRLPTERGEPMTTLHFGLRGADLDRSLAFYTDVGYEVVGSVPETRWAT
jgi:RibD C-terminal domain